METLVDDLILNLSDASLAAMERRYAGLLKAGDEGARPCWFALMAEEERRSMEAEEAAEAEHDAMMREEWDAASDLARIGTEPDTGPTAAELAAA